MHYGVDEQVLVSQSICLNTDECMLFYGYNTIYCKLLLTTHAYSTT